MQIDRKLCSFSSSGKENVHLTEGGLNEILLLNYECYCAVVISSITYQWQTS